MGAKLHSFNFVQAHIGYPETGKSYNAMQCLNELRKSKLHPYVVISDPQWNLEDEEYPGIRRYETLSEFEDGFSGEPGGLHCFPEYEGEAAIEYAILVAKKSVELYGKQDAPPVIVYIDEMSLVAEAMSNKFQSSDTMKRFLTNRRHMHVGLIWGIQSPRMLHSSLVMMTTEVRLFGIADDADLKFLRSNNVPSDIVDQLPTLPDREYLVFNPRKRPDKQVKK